MHTSITFRRTILPLAILMIVAAMGPAAYSQDTLLISYQGRLTDDGGDPVTGTPAMMFKIYDGGGVSKWSEAHATVQVDGGLFNVILGSQTALPDSVFNGEDRYLGISVDAEDEMSPRTLLTSSPGAAVSRRVVGDILTAPGVLVVANSADDSAIVLMAESEAHVIRIHPPEPCTPPDPCIPALELIADTEVHSMKIYPPTPEENTPSVEILTTAGVATVMVQGPDLVEGQSQIAFVADVDGAKVGIGTGLPECALDVHGTADIEGFKMATGALDGHVLMSDGSGNGTWQAPGSGGSKAACADMYESTTNSSSQVTITFPVTFTAAPYFAVTGLIKSGDQAGQMAHVIVSSLTTTGVTLTIQYWDRIVFADVGNSVAMLLSYTAIEM